MKKILLIDYDQASLAALHKTLSQEGFEVTVAGDGQAGWEKFQSEKPDLVLMEAMLSKIHGFELCDRITKDPVRKVPVFIMTGVYKDRVYRTEALRTYGASEYFEKPLDMLKFIASIHAVLTVPDIKPGPELKPGNGEPAEDAGPVPVVKPVKEEPRRVEPQPEPRHVREDSPRTRPASGPRPAPGMEEGLSLEGVLNVRPVKEEHRRPEPGHDIRPASTMIPKAKSAQEGRSILDDDLRLESLLNSLPAKDEPRRPEPMKGGGLAHGVSKGLDERPHEHPKQDHEAEDIDKLLKTTLADFGLESDKRKPARPVPHPVPAPPPPPEKPKAPAPASAFEKPRSAAPPAPTTAPQKPRPFPSAAPPAAPVEEPKAATPPPMPAAVAEKPKPPQPALATPRAQPQTRPLTPPPQAPPQARPTPMPQPVQPAAAPAKPKAQPKPEPTAPEEKHAPKEPGRTHEPHKGTGTKMFKDIYEVEKKKSPAPFIAVGAGLVVVAAVGYFILRPKPPSNVTGNLPKNPARVMQSAPSENPPATSVASLSEEKLKTVNPRVKTGAQVNPNRPADPLPTAEDAIVPAQSGDISRLSIPAAAGAKPEAKPGDAKQADTKATETKAGDTKSAEAQAQGQPPAKTEATPPQGTSGNGDEAANQGPAAAKANPGELVDLAAVDELPKVQKSVQPEYPAQAMRFGKEGSVTVNALIDETGAVINTGILKGLKDDMGLEKAAAEAVRKWKFQPAKKDGVNVKVWKPVVITFKANRSKQS